MSNASETVGRVNAAIKALLLEVKNLAGSLPDVESRDTAQIVVGCQEISRLTTAFTATLRDANDAASTPATSSPFKNSNGSGISSSNSTQFDDAMLSALKERVQSFLALVKRFVAEDTYDDDATNATVLAITAAIKPVIEVVNKRKTLLLQQQQLQQHTNGADDVSPSSYSTSPPIPIASSSSSASSPAPAASSPAAISTSPPKESVTSASPPDTNGAAAGADASADGAKKESFARKFSRSISNAKDQVLSRLKRSQTNEGDDPNGAGAADEASSPQSTSPRGSAGTAEAAADMRDSSGKSSADKPSRFRDLFRSNTTASANPSADASTHGTTDAAGASSRADDTGTAATAAGASPHNEPPKRKNSAPGGSKPGFMENMKRRFRLPQGWYKFKLSKEKKEQTKKKLENDLQQIDDVESEPIVEQMKKLDDETVTAGDVGEIAIAVKTARTNLEARQSTTPAQNTKARESIVILKSMEATLAQTLRDSIVIAPAAAAAATAGAGAPPSPPSARAQQSQPPMPSSKPAAKSSPSNATVRAAPPAAAALSADDTAELDALLGTADATVDLVALESILDEPAAPAATTAPASSSAAASEEEQWGAIEDLLSEYA